MDRTRGGRLRRRRFGLLRTVVKIGLVALGVLGVEFLWLAIFGGL